MPPRLVVAAECHVDTALAHALVRGQRRLVNHLKGVPNLGKYLDKLAVSQEHLLVIGLVDNDPDLFERPGIKSYQRNWLPAYTFTEYGFQVFTCAERPSHYLVVLEPACDKWLYREAGKIPGLLGAAPSQMPAEWLAFLAITKQQAAEDNPRIIRLLRELKRQPPPAFGLLLAFTEAQMQEAEIPQY